MTHWKSLAFLVITAALMTTVAATSEQNTTLDAMGQKIKIDKTKISVSGISSGGFMAHQFHVAHSADLMGAGIIAGGFYYCAQGYLNMAMGECTTIGEEPLFGWKPVPYSGPCPAPPAQQERCKDKAVDMADQAVKYTLKLDKDKIDNPMNLIGDQVILILGKSDRLVPEGVMDATNLYYKKIYKNYGQTPQADTLIYLKTLPSEHSVPIDNFIGLKVAKGDKVIVEKGEQVGNCTTFGSPFLNFCAKQDCDNSCCTPKTCTGYNDLTVSDCKDDCNPQCSTQCVTSIDAAGAILGHIYGHFDHPNHGLNPRDDDFRAKNWDQFGTPTVGEDCWKGDEIDARCHWLRERIFVFDQDSKLPDGFPTFLAEKGFLFVPKQCIDSNTRCKLHIAFHGCEQGYVKDKNKDKDTVNAPYSNVWTNFVENAGFNEWADSNNIVVLYPQSLTDHSGLVVLNPKGCWDFWGFVGKNSNYHTKDGRQISAVWKMVEQLVPSLRKNP